MECLDHLELLREDIDNYTSVFKSTKIIDDLNTVNNQKNEILFKLVQINEQINLYENKKKITSQINKVKTNQNLFQILVKVAYDENGTLEFELVRSTNLNHSTGRIKVKSNIQDEGSHGRLYMKINMFDLYWFIISLGKDLGLTFLLLHDVSYSKSSKHLKEQLLIEAHDQLQILDKGQYFVRLNYR